MTETNSDSSYTVPKSHPRYTSLMTREKIVRGVEKGITSLHGLIAQGRGEAFDYLLGERTIESALLAEKTAAALLLLSERPVISVNGNTAALVPDEVITLGRIVNARIEVNIFHRSEERIKKIIDYLKSRGAGDLAEERDQKIPGIEHARSTVSSKGIFAADTVLVPLEDGDRCKALVDMGKKVIAIDLNPLSRTSRTANVTIVDNIVRAIPNMIKFANQLKDYDKEMLIRIVSDYDNKYILEDAIRIIRA